MLALQLGIVCLQRHVVRVVLLVGDPEFRGVFVHAQFVAVRWHLVCSTSCSAGARVAMWCVGALCFAADPDAVARPTPVFSFLVLRRILFFSTQMRGKWKKKRMRRLKRKRRRMRARSK